MSIGHSREPWCQREDFLTEKDSTLKGTPKTPSVLPQPSKAKLMSSSVVVRLADFNIYQVCIKSFHCISNPIN